MGARHGGPLVGSRLARSVCMRRFIWAAGALLLVFGVFSWRWLQQRPYRPVAVAAAGAALAPDDGSDPDAAALAVDAGASARAAPPDIARDAGARWAATQIPQIIPTLSVTENILLVGLDRHRGVIRGGRTDTLIVAAFDDDSGHLALIGIPRDLWVDIPEREPNRINAVFGLAQRAKQDPFAALQRVIVDTLGIPIAHSVAIDLGVFERIIDDVGGVTVDVQCPIVDDFLDVRLDGGRRVLKLEAGPQHLDGPTAAMFIRSRHGRSDWSRARRQQLVLRGLHQKLANVQGLAKLPKLFASVEQSVLSNMSRLQLLALARRVLQQEPSKVHGVVLGHRETIPHRNEKNWAVLLPEPEAIARRLETVFEAGAPGERPEPVACPNAAAALRRKRQR